MMREEADGHAAQSACEQRRLRWPRHAHGDVGIAAQEILVGIGERKLDDDFRDAPRETR